MEKIKINFVKLNDDAVTPTFGTEFSAGGDLYSIADYEIAPGETVLVHTGISVEIPTGCVGMIFARSGLSTRRGLAPANKVGVIDSDYRGEIMTPLYNQSSQMQKVEKGERIAQMVIMPYVAVEYEQQAELSNTQRGTSGFGSTGRK